MLHNMDMYASVRPLSEEELCKVPVGCLILRDRHLKILKIDENKIVLMVDLMGALPPHIQH